jgi:hypothetical protein
MPPREELVEVRTYGSITAKPNSVSKDYSSYLSYL